MLLSPRTFWAGARDRAGGRVYAAGGCVPRTYRISLASVALKELVVVGAPASTSLPSYVVP